MAHRYNRNFNYPSPSAQPALAADGAARRRWTAVSLAPRRTTMSSSQTSAAGLELVRAESQHVGEMGRICYEAFKDLHDRHRFPLDFPSAALARQVLGMMVSRSDFYSVVALLDGQVVGSNFLSLADP